MTCGPYFTLKAMPKLKSNHGVKYILDFRDLGALNYRPKLFTEGDQKKTSWWKKPILNWYHTKVSNRERKAVKNADGIICVSPIDKKKMQRGRLDAGRGKRGAKISETCAGSPDNSVYAGSGRLWA